MRGAPELRAWIAADPFRIDCLRTLATEAPAAWIGAGFVRSLVFDRIAGVATPLEDIDVVVFGDGQRAGEAALEGRLRDVRPEVPWSVRDQARMHTHNGDEPYADLAAALSCWPETATAVAARWCRDRDAIELLAPLGLDDLLAGVVRATPHMGSRPDRAAVFAHRARQKRWQVRWPGVRVAP